MDGDGRDYLQQSQVKINIVISGTLLKIELINFSIFSSSLNVGIIIAIFFTLLYFYKIISAIL